MPKSQTLSFTADNLDGIEEQMLGYFVQAQAGPTAMHAIAKRGGFADAFAEVFYSEGPAPLQVAAAEPAGLTEPTAPEEAAPAPVATAKAAPASGRTPIDVLLAADKRVAKDSTTLGSGETVGLGAEVLTPDGEVGVIAKLFRGGAIVEFDDGSGGEFKSAEMRTVAQSDTPAATAGAPEKAAEPAPAPAPAADGKMPAERAAELGSLATEMVSRGVAQPQDVFAKVLQPYGASAFAMIPADKYDEVKAQLLTLDPANAPTLSAGMNW